MNLCGRVIDVAHIADLLAFSEAAAGTEVRLDQINDVILEERAESPAREDAFTRSDRNIHVVVHFLQLHRVEAHYRFLVGGDPEFLDHAAELDGGRGIRQGVSLNDDVNLITDRFADCLQAVIAHAEIAARKAAVKIAALRIPLEVDFVHVNLDAVIPLLERLFGCRGVLSGSDENVFLFGVAPAKLQLRGIRPKLIAALAAEELIAGNAESLALDVPKRYVDCRHTGRNDRAAALTPEGFLLELVPNEFIPHRVEPDKQLREILSHAETGRCAYAIGKTDFAEAGNAFVRIDTNDDGSPLGNSGLKRILNVNYVHTDDFHL